MIVLTLTACPAGLRGDLTKWVLEISPGVFVGHVSARVRDELWERVCELSRDGRAIMVYSSNGEQRLKFKVHRHDWEPVDLEGLTLVRRQNPEGAKYARRTGWSQARAIKRGRRPQWSQRGETEK